MHIAIPKIERLQAVLHRFFPDVEADGDIGRRTKGAVRELAAGRGKYVGEEDARREIQGILHELFPQVQVDGRIGPITWSAIELLDEMGDHESMAEKLPQIEAAHGADGWSKAVLASSFADPGDVRRFFACKADGGSDMHCFAVGDNGIGKWGANCAQDVHPYVALPREIWRAAGKTGGALLAVKFPEVEEFRVQLGDTMPSLDNIKNGAGMDCNPAVLKIAGRKAPMMLRGVKYKWL